MKEAVVILILVMLGGMIGYVFGTIMEDIDKAKRRHRGLDKQRQKCYYQIKNNRRTRAWHL